MTRKRPDYTEARNYYIKGERNEYPTLQDIATEFNYSLSTLRKQAANEGWLANRTQNNENFWSRLLSYFGFDSSGKLLISDIAENEKNKLRLIYCYAKI